MLRDIHYVFIRNVVTGRKDYYFFTDVVFDIKSINYVTDIGDTDLRNFGDHKSCRHLECNATPIVKTAPVHAHRPTIIGSTISTCSYLNNTRTVEYSIFFSTAAVAADGVTVPLGLTDNNCEEMKLARTAFPPFEPLDSEWKLYIYME